ncbi:flotillin-related [Holotrichia oblita]|uniref:Flotillin-related n=1 Tax=Holotrichia oblita TaxID=644536 RepID=A0ACB9SIP8_HOLOL|nr:flotillin-related [Holotrichia oblita]
MQDQTNYWQQRQQYPPNNYAQNQHNHPNHYQQQQLYNQHNPQQNYYSFGVTPPLLNDQYNQQTQYYNYNNAEVQNIPIRGGIGDGATTQPGQNANPVPMQVPPTASPNPISNRSKCHNEEANSHYFFFGIGTLTVEEVYRDRDQFAALVREVAAPDVGRMGIEILSFTIKDVYDNVQYLASLGKAQTAMVKRDADTGVAEANRDAGIREAECQKAAMDVKYSTDTKIEDNSRMFKLQKANFDQEINTAKAEAQLAYELQAAKIRQKIRNEEIQIDVVERRKQIEVETQEVMRKERELNATVRLPAEAEAYRLELIAEAKRTQTVQAAKADAEKMKMLGTAEAASIAAVGKAEAERMRQKAAIYKQYGDAAIMSIVLEALPKNKEGNITQSEEEYKNIWKEYFKELLVDDNEELTMELEEESRESEAESSIIEESTIEEIAAEVSAPLAKTEEIVLIGGSDNTTAEISRLVGQIPPAVNALTGVDLSKVLGKIPGAQQMATVK